MTTEEWKDVSETVGEGVYDAVLNLMGNGIVLGSVTKLEAMRYILNSISSSMRNKLIGRDYEYEAILSSMRQVTEAYSQLMRIEEERSYARRSTGTEAPTGSITFNPITLPATGTYTTGRSNIFLDEARANQGWYTTVTPEV